MISARKVIDRAGLKSGLDTDGRVSANIPPPRPAIPAASEKAASFIRVSEMPTAVAAFSESRTAKKARPLGLRCSASTPTETTTKPTSSVQKSEWAVGSVRSMGPALAFTVWPAGPPLSGNDWAKKSWSPGSRPRAGGRGHAAQGCR